MASDNDIPAVPLVMNQHLVDAGNAMSPKIKDVGRGLPFLRGNQIRWYYAGEEKPVKMGESAAVLDGQMVGQQYAIVTFWEVPDGSETANATLDVDMYNLVAEVRTRLQGDSQLGGHVTDLDLDYAELDLVTIDNGLHVAVTQLLHLSYREYPIVS